jgi:hypothetical protein
LFEESKEPFTHKECALDACAPLDQLGVSKFKAMGISTDGMTLIHIPTQQPSRIESMVLVRATTYFSEQARDLMRHDTPESHSQGDAAASSRGF